MLLVCLGKLKWKVVSRLIRNHRSEGDVMATATQSAHRTELDARKRSSTVFQFEEALREKIVRQDEAVLSHRNVAQGEMNRGLHYGYRGPAQMRSRAVPVSDSFHARVYLSLAL